MRVVYLDMLFFINFAADYLLLSLTAYLRGVTAGEWRLLASAVFGGLSASALFFAPTGGVLFLLAKPACCFIMALIAFGYGGRKKLAGDCAVLCVVSFILSGVMIAVSQLAPHSGGTVKNTAIYFNISFRTFIVASLLTYALISFFVRKGSCKQERKTVKVKCLIGDVSLGFAAFEDTGNMLYDAVSGKRIIVVSPSILSAALGGEEGKIISNIAEDGGVIEAVSRLAEFSPTRYGVTTYTSAGGKGLMITVKPDSLTVDDEAVSDMILGIAMDEIETVLGCRAIIGC